MNNSDINTFISKTNLIINEIIDELKYLLSLSEKEFSTLGEKLRFYYSSSKKTCSQAASLADLFSSDNFQQKIEELTSISVEIFSNISSTNQKFNNSNKDLEKILELINSTTGEVTNFGRLVKYLRIQGISTKIESARLGSNDVGFSNLAENVEQLSNVISDKSTGFREKAMVLTKTINAVGTKNHELEKAQKEYTFEIEGNTKDSIKILQEKYELSSQKSGTISNNFELAQKKIGEIVTSIQFHDITRQQIEHVIEALELLVSKVSERKNENGEYPDSVYTVINTVSKVQRAQLDNSKRELNNAVETILLNLDGVVENIENINVDASQLLQNDSNSYTPFIENIKDGLTKVIDSLNSNEEVSSQLSDSIMGVEDTLRELTGFVNEINSIGSEIELISLNANIKAAHIGQEGAALGVLAKEIQKLSIDAIKQTGSVIDNLTEINSIADELHKDIVNNNKDKENKNELKDIQININHSISALNSLIETGSSQLADIDSATSFLQAEISATINNVTIHSEVNNHVNNISTFFDELIYMSAPFVDPSHMKDPLLEEFNKGYTMEEQRRIHNKISANSEDVELFNDNEIDNAGNTEFGDNVELF